MKENKEEQLVADFFESRRQIIPDDGFSNRVMRHLPRRVDALSSYFTYLSGAVALLLFYWGNGFALLKTELGKLFGDCLGVLLAFQADYSSPLLLLSGFLLLAVVAIYELYQEAT